MDSENMSTKEEMAKSEDFEELPPTTPVDLLHDIVHDTDDANNLYRTSRDVATGHVTFDLALPNDEIMSSLFNNKTINSIPGAHLKIINMEWRYLRRKVIKWLGDTPESRAIHDALGVHIKKEKKWKLTQERVQ
jgi:hypothetical protein